MTKEFNPTFKDPQQAFEKAIEEKRLTINPDNDNFAGHYMYMGTWDDKDHFKNSLYRNYLK